jgi:hypothetical protein
VAALPNSVLVGLAADCVTVIDPTECAGLIALRESTTWGEFRRSAPACFVEEVDTRFREARRNGVEVPRRRDADPLDFETIPGAGEAIGRLFSKTCWSGFLLRCSSSSVKQSLHH